MLKHSHIIATFREVICRDTCSRSGSHCSIWPEPSVTQCGEFVSGASRSGMSGSDASGSGVSGSGVSGSGASGSGESGSGASGSGASGSGVSGSGVSGSILCALALAYLKFFHPYRVLLIEVANVLHNKSIHSRTYTKECIQSSLLNKNFNCNSRLQFMS